jgi:hypothetical protein
MRGMGFLPSSAIVAALSIAPACAQTDTWRADALPGNPAAVIDQVRGAL